MSDTSVDGSKLPPAIGTGTAEIRVFPMIADLLPPMPAMPPPKAEDTAEE